MAPRSERTAGNAMTATPGLTAAHHHKQRLPQRYPTAQMAQNACGGMQIERGTLHNATPKWPLTACRGRSAGNAADGTAIPYPPEPARRRTLRHETGIARIQTTPKYHNHPSRLRYIGKAPQYRHKIMDIGRLMPVCIRASGSARRGDAPASVQHHCGTGARAQQAGRGRAGHEGARGRTALRPAGRQAP